MQDAIAARFGIRCVNTLTGFKWISSKLAKYEAQLGIGDAYRDLDEKGTRELRLAKSTFLVFGGEESYGYMGSDYSRDKDGNGAVVMFAELAAFAASRGQTIVELLDEVYSDIGYYLEVNKSKTFEGAEGAAKIAKLADSYGSQPPTVIDGVAVTSVRDFRKDHILDEEGDRVPAEKMLFVDLADGRSFAVRPSGTEPKIKYYMFGNTLPVAGETFDLPAAKQKATQSLTSLWAWLEADINARLAA
jgi:phosphoglucomutase